jgi:hypothetical protein
VHSRRYFILKLTRRFWTTTWCVDYFTVLPIQNVELLKETRHRKFPRDTVASAFQFLIFKRIYFVGHDSILPLFYILLTSRLFLNNLFSWNSMVKHKNRLAYVDRLYCIKLVFHHGFCTVSWWEKLYFPNAAVCLLLLSKGDLCSPLSLRRLWCSVYSLPHSCGS